MGFRAYIGFMILELGVSNSGLLGSKFSEIALQRLRRNLATALLHVAVQGSSARLF